MKRWAILDVNYLCYRAWFAMGTLQYGDIFTGVTFGVLRDIMSIQDRFDPSCFIFCFDLGPSRRQERFPEYKRDRRKGMSQDDIEMFGHFRSQVKALRKEYLPSLGFKNIFYQKGYEADDCIASISLRHCTRKDIHHIIVSSDSDLYQLLGPRVSIFKPRGEELISERSFKDTWHIEPSAWIDVKAIAGCKSDCIPGVKGVGEKTAAKYLAGTLNPESKAYQAIVKGNHIWRENYPLVQLPYPGIRNFQVCENETVNADNWVQLADRLGFKSIRGSFGA